MILLVIFLCGSFLISPSLASEDLVSQCHKDYFNLLRKHSNLQEKNLEKYAQVIQCQRVHSEVQNKYTEVLQKLDDCNVKYDKLQPKPLEVDTLRAFITQQKEEIELLKYQIGELKEKCELGKLTNQFREDIAKLAEIVKNGEPPRSKVANNDTQENIQVAENTNSNNKTETVEVKTEEIPTNQEDISRNQTKVIPQPSDRCPESQDDRDILQEIQIPGTSPFKVNCFADEDIGSGWMVVYNKVSFSFAFSRPYEDYERGFGEVLTKADDEFFIGLERLHLLTSEKPYEASLYYDEGLTKCDHFVVGNRSEGYMLRNIGWYTGGSTMGLRQGTKFSTFDRDEDGHADNLAMKKGYGWWFDQNYTRTKNLILLIRRTD